MIRVFPCVTIRRPITTPAPTTTPEPPTTTPEPTTQYHLYTFKIEAPTTQTSETFIYRTQTPLNGETKGTSSATDHGNVYVFTGSVEGYGELNNETGLLETTSINENFQKLINHWNASLAMFHEKGGVGTIHRLECEIINNTFVMRAYADDLIEILVISYRDSEFIAKSIIIYKEDSTIVDI